MYRFFIYLLILSTTLACSFPEHHQQSSVNLQKLVADPLTPEETTDLLEESTKNWAYGNGLGDSVAKIGASIIFPPFALVWLGNTVAEFAGYQGISKKDILPKKIERAYTGVTNIPGNIIAKAGGEEFRTTEQAFQEVEKILKSHENPVDFSDV